MQPGDKASVPAGERSEAGHLDHTAGLARRVQDTGAAAAILLAL